ncbi:MAG: type II toxin-antitoxin system RelE/ParE family toxin [Treponema sp.]|jgi:addiction module RelE/StbE family toxin|nr:type II toxin-antitoxin system RelE/ParE family toxin [Treponema sp.]
MDDEIKEYHVNVNKTAEKDLREIIKYISKNNPMNALNVLERIEKRINFLNKFPEKGGYVPELLKNNIKDYRQLIEPPWRIIYRIDDNIVNVLIIIDSRRNVQDILVERLLK